MKPAITVMIPAYNEEKLIGECIDSVLNSDFPKEKIEVMVIDDGSTDRTVEIAMSKRAAVLKQDHKGVGAARNLGVSKAKGKIVVSMDADQLLHKDFLKEVDNAFRDRMIGGINPREIAISKDSFVGKSIVVNTDWARIGERELKTGDDHKGEVVRAFRKDLFLKAKGMDTSLGFYDDAVAGKIRDFGSRTIDVKEAVIYHYCHLTLKSVASQATWIGRSYVDYLRKRNESWMWKNVLVTLYGFSVLLSPVLAFARWWLPLAYAAPFMLYELRKMVLIFARKRRTAYVLMVPVLDLFKSFFRTFGMLTKVVGYKKNVGGKIF